MKKIELDPKRTIIAFLIFSALLCLLKMNLKDTVGLFLLISIAGTPIIALILKMRRSRKAGLYFSSEGVTYNNGLKTYFSPWNKVNAEVSTNLGLFKEIKLTLSKEKTVSFGVGWITENDLRNAVHCVPKDHKLYPFIEKYI